jgi:hypothetical protein
LLASDSGSTLAARTWLLGLCGSANSGFSGYGPRVLACHLGGTCIVCRDRGLLPGGSAVAGWHGSVHGGRAGCSPVHTRVGLAHNGTGVRLRLQPTGTAGRILILLQGMVELMAEATQFYQWEPMTGVSAQGTCSQTRMTALKIILDSQ